MRILFATSDLRLPADLVAGYASVDVTGVLSSFAEAIDSIAAATQQNPIDTVVLSAELTAGRDRAAGMDLAEALMALRSANTSIRIIVATSTAEPLPGVQAAGAEQFIAHDRDRAASNLAALLNLVAKGEIAKIIVFAGLQGGAGRTTLAQAIGASITELLDQDRGSGRGGVLVWEMDLGHPTIAYDQDVDLITGSHGKQTIARLLNSTPVEGEEGMATITQSIIRSESSRLPYDLLLAPYGIREVVGILQSYPKLLELRTRMARILEIVSRHYRVIVLDVSANPYNDPGTQVALSAATAICVVATPSPAGLSSVLGMKNILADIHAQDRSRLVLNRIRRDPVDASYAKLCESQVRDTIEMIAQIPEGASPDVFPRIAARLLEIGS